jgi:hypothetical protein
MDSLPLNLTAICQRVDRIDATRVINASARRGSFQAKIGSGMRVDDFEANMAAGCMGHVGLPESVGMVFGTLGKAMTRYESGVRPDGENRHIDPNLLRASRQATLRPASSVCPRLDAWDEMSIMVLLNTPSQHVVSSWM